MKKLLKVRMSAVMLVVALGFGLLLAPVSVLAATPTVANAIPNQNATKSVAFNFQFASNTFNDSDLGDTLSYTSQLNGGGALPAWLSFDGVTRTFSGTPTNGDVGTISLDVTADDGNGGSVTDTFDIVVASVAESTCATYGMGEDAGVCQVSDCEQLFAWSAGPDAASMTRSYKVTNDLICPGDMTMAPIGSDTLVFGGTFDGGYHTIRYLFIDAAGGWNAGLFSNASDAAFMNLNIFYANISGHGYSGSLLGYADSNTTIKNIHVDDIYINSSANIGGLVGYMTGNSLISYSSVSGSQLNGTGDQIGGLVGQIVGTGSALAVSRSSVSSTTIVGNSNVAGLVGYAGNIKIENSYANATIAAAGDQIGGLVGVITSGTIISRSYAAGSINASNTAVAGLVGSIFGTTTIANSFAAVSGTSVNAFFGTYDSDYPSLSNNYYDNTIQNINTCNAFSAGQEDNCGYDGGGAGDWLNGTKQPIASWDTWHTWNLHPSSGSFPTLVSEGGIADAPFDGGNGTTNPYLISNCRQLQHMRDNMNANYKLSTDVDCSETIDWFDGKGFDPVGDNTDPFYGNLDGNGKTINDLYINRVNDTPGDQEGDESFVGLFGYIQFGGAQDINLANAKVRGYMSVGGLAGLLDDATVVNVHVNVDVATNDCLSGGHCVWARYGTNGGGIVGNAVNGSYVGDSSSGGPIKGSGIKIGGIVGWAETGTQIENVNSSSAIDGGTDVGGIAGRLDSSMLVNAHATGDVLVQTDDIKPGDSGGGLVGASVDSTISDSSASGIVSGRDNIGGLVGYVDNSSITNATSNGATVDGSDNVGGFVGLVSESDIYESESQVTETTGISENAGGFAGLALCNVYFEDSSSTTNVSGWQYAGGFAGQDGCEGSASAAYYQVHATGDVEGYAVTGGLIGYSALSTVDQSSATGDVIGTFNTGGLIGALAGNGWDDEEYPTLVTKSYATGDVIGVSSSGGLVGSLSGGVVSNSYARGDVYDEDSAGGIAGSASGDSAIQYSYSTGLVSSDIMAPQGIAGTWGLELLVNSSFWDATVNPDLDTSNGFGTGLSTADLQTQSILSNANWDFNAIWRMQNDANDGYACLQWDQNCYSQSDTDGDGISDTVENAGPNSGDANNDGTPDANQANVTGFVNATTGKYTVVQTGCTTNINVQSGRESAEHIDAGYDYPAELQSFVGIGCGAPGSTVNVTLYYFGDFDSSKFVLRKSADNTYRTISSASLTSSTIGGLSVLTASYQVVDGGVLDQDHLADSNIVDPVGLAQSVVGAPNTGIR